MRAAVLLLALVAPAMAGTWSKVGVIDDVVTAIQFLNATEGYFSAAASSGTAGLQCLYTNDGGKTINDNPVDGGLLPLSLAVGPPHVLLGSIFTDWVSHDNGKTFTATKGAHVQSQCQRYANGMFFSVGTEDLGSGEGVAVSVDHGATFKGYFAPCAKSQARYGAFPGKSTWYLTLGSWPETDDDNSNPSTDDETAPLLSAYQAYSRRLAANGTGWAAQIVKTADGGATWTSQFEDDGSFYFNEMACESETLCCAAGEADNTSPNPGIRIYCTEDGEKWTRNYFDATGLSLMTMSSVGNGEFIAGGIFADNNEAVPGFIFSKDGGKTWALEEVTDVGEVAIIASSFPNKDVGFAVGINQFNSMTLIKYTA